MWNDKGAPPRGGFTLIEVLVALAIAAGSLVLLLSAGQSSLRRSLWARQDEALEARIASKLAEWRCGADPSSRGEFEGLPGWSFEIRTERAEVEDLKGLDLVTLSAFGPDSHGKPVKTAAFYRYAAPSSP